jgi:hypothetical protein
MAYTTIDKPTDYFNTKLYTGNGSSSHAITGVGFQPDWTWIKGRHVSAHKLTDAVRGVTKELESHSTGAEYTEANGLKVFGADGFTVGSDGAYNGNTNSYVSWNWLAGGTAPAITYTVKVVSDSGNKYRFNDFGTSAVTLDLQEGGTYTFDQSDSSNSGHPLRFSTTSNGSHGGGSEYTTGVTTTGTPGNAGAKTVITVASGAATLYYYCTQHSAMGGQANTNSTFGSSNFGGSIQANVSANTTAGFSIVSYVGTSSAATVAHGLSAVPSCIIWKNRSATSNWVLWHKGLGGANKAMTLQESETVFTNTAFMNNTLPTSSVFSIGDYGNTNGGSENMIAYCFTEKQGFSSFGSYTGNGNASGPMIFTGFKPAFFLVKYDGTQGWGMFDNKRNPHNTVSQRLWANENTTESGTQVIDFISTGLKIGAANSYWNASGGSYIYLAFAENPFVTSTGVPATAR